MGDSEVLDQPCGCWKPELQGGHSRAPTRADGVTDVLVAAPNSVWVDDGSGLARSAVTFADESSVRRLAQRFALAAGRRLDEAQPWVDGRLPGIGRDGLTVRLHAVLPPVASAGTCLSLRVLRPATQDLASLSAAGTIDRVALQLIADIVEARLAFVVSGGTGAGRPPSSPPFSARSARASGSSASRMHRNWLPHPHFVRLVARGERGGCR